MQATVLSTGHQSGQPTAQCDPVNLESALSRLGEYVIACCVSFPSDEEFDLRLRTRCASLESGLPPAELARWQVERDNLLMRLGCRPRGY